MRKVSFLSRLRHEQLLATTSIVVERLSELGLLSQEALGMTAQEVVDAMVRSNDGESVIGRLVSKVTRSPSATGETAQPPGDFTRDAGDLSLKFVKGSKKSGVVVTGPGCPKCGAPTVLRKAAKTNRVFLACSTYGETGCTGTLSITQAK